MIQFNFNGQNIQMEQDPNTMLMNEIYKECMEHQGCSGCKAKPQGVVRDYGVIVCENCDLYKQQGQ